MGAVNAINKPRVTRVSAESRLARQAKLAAATQPAVKAEEPPWAPQVFDNEAVARTIEGITEHHVVTLREALNRIDRVYTQRDRQHQRMRDREARIQDYISHYAAIRMQQEREKRAAEARKNFNPSEEEKMNFMLDFCGVNSQARRVEKGGVPKPHYSGNGGLNFHWMTISHCCGTAHSSWDNDPERSDWRAERIRWEFLEPGQEPKLFECSPETVRIHDHGSNLDLHLSWANK